MPLLQVIVITPFFLKHVWNWRLWRASGLVLLWSLVLTVSVAAASYSIGCSIDHVSRIIKGQSYLSEMIHWIETGEGPEGDPSLFIVPKTIEIGLFFNCHVLNNRHWQPLHGSHTIELHESILWHSHIHG